MVDKASKPTGAKTAPPSRPDIEPSQHSSTSNTDTAALGAMSTTPDGSDDESGSVSPSDDVSASGSTRSQDLVKEEPEGESGASKRTGPSMPMQKRRRVTRACDECRRKKIKCDGKQPCTHCSVYSYDCTFDKPSNRRRNPAPQYIEALENRLQRAEALLRKYVPDFDLSDPNLDPSVQQEFRNREQARAQAARLKKESASKDAENPDAQIMSMIETIGQLDLSEGGEWDFHGTSSGAVFLRRMKEHFRGLLGNDYRTPFLPRPPRPPGMFSIDSPRSNVSSPWDSSSTPNIYDLPPKEKARELCYYSLTCATCLLRIVHAPTFYEMFDRVYELPPERFGIEENRFLSLLYSVLALGCMYNTSADGQGNRVTYQMAMEEGLKYYATARLLLQDIAECRDLTSLQALLYMLLFLQVTANLSGCYSFVGIALRSAIRMGLHRHLKHAKINPIEDETRRRCFYALRQMDIYISAILGFPMFLNESDIDQPLPTEVDDQYITKDKILTPPAGTSSALQAFNAHYRLMRILTKVVQHIYPLKGVEECVMNAGRHNATYMINYAKIREIEQDLQEWYEQLPIHWRPSPEGPIEVIRIRTLLRFGYAHVQMMLYRPFLHYASPRLSAGKNIDERYYACAAAGISVSRNIVHIGIELKKQAVLIGPYWFILYTEFFAILSLVFYVLENQDKPGAADILEDARAGSEVIANLVQRSVAADRVTTALSALFEQLPDRLKKMKDPVVSKKRAASIAKASGASHPTGGGKTQGRTSKSTAPHTKIPGEDHPSLLQRPSFDAGRMRQGSHQGSGFAAHFADLHPLEISAMAESSERSPPTQPQPFLQMHTPGGNHMFKLDTVMFPSNDPFAYPNQQPLMDFAGAIAAARQTPHAAEASQRADSIQFFLPNMYDDIEGQLLGPIPPYLHHQGQPAQQLLDPTAQVYNTTNMLSLQGQGQQQLTEQQRRQMELEAMLADPAFRGADWADILGGGGGYRQL